MLFNTLKFIHEIRLSSRFSSGIEQYQSHFLLVKPKPYLLILFTHKFECKYNTHSQRHRVAKNRCLNLIENHKPYKTNSFETTKLPQGKNFVIQILHKYRRWPRKAEAVARTEWASESESRAGRGRGEVYRGGHKVANRLHWLQTCQTTHWVISNKRCVSCFNDSVMYGAIVLRHAGFLLR